MLDDYDKGCNGGKGVEVVFCDILFLPLLLPLQHLQLYVHV